MATVIESLVESVRSVAKEDQSARTRPVCILWPDRGREWEKAVPEIRKTLPELLTLGPYDPESLTGPGIWIRCAVAGRLGEFRCPDGLCPVIYLPGYGRQDVRAVDTCPEDLKPVAELQYRGAFWSHPSSRDWTATSFLSADPGEGGLGLSLEKDGASGTALPASLDKLLPMEVPALKGSRLDKAFIGKLQVADLDSAVLSWISGPESYRSASNQAHWDSFVGLCESELRFNPESVGPTLAAELLAGRERKWARVWNRYIEAPRKYPGVPDQLRRLTPESNLKWSMGPGEGFYDPWPQWNDIGENELRHALSGFSAFQPREARETILSLEEKHAPRRGRVWAELGEAPLARALGHLASAAGASERSLAGGEMADLEEGYVSGGWKADDGVARALAEVEADSDVKAVTVAVRAFYHQWVEDSASHLQKVASVSGYPGGRLSAADGPDYRPGDCVLFVDGLRFDVAKRLSGRLSGPDYGFNVAETPVWAALPSVTATGKPAVSPVRGEITGAPGHPDFQPCVASTGSALTQEGLRQLLRKAGWEVLEGAEPWDGEAKGWNECGNIDHDGHSLKTRLASQLEGLVRQLSLRVADLLAAGWRRVLVVTDHGWLLMPGGLDKTELPAQLASGKWSRCASVKDGAQVAQRLFPWHWNPAEHYALATGASCFSAGEEYAHGGLSLQECLTLRLEVSEGAGQGEGTGLRISRHVWVSSRCTVTVADGAEGLTLDIRTLPGDPGSSVVNRPARFKPDPKAGGNSWTAAVAFLDDKASEGAGAFLVVLDASGGTAALGRTVLGGEGRTGQ